MCTPKVAWFGFYLWMCVVRVLLLSLKSLTFETGLLDFICFDGHEQLGFVPVGTLNTIIAPTIVLVILH